MKKKCMAMLLAAAMALTSMESGVLAVSGADFTSESAEESGSEALADIGTEEAELADVVENNNVESSIAETETLVTETEMPDVEDAGSIEAESTNESTTERDASEKYFTDGTAEAEEEIQSVGDSAETVQKLELTLSKTEFTSIIDDQPDIDNIPATVKITYENGSEVTCSEDNIRYGMHDSNDNYFSLVVINGNGEETELSDAIGTPGQYRLYLSYSDDINSNSCTFTVKDFDFENYQKLELGKEYSVLAQSSNYYTYNGDGGLIKWMMNALDGQENEYSVHLYKYNEYDDSWNIHERLTEYYPWEISSGTKYVLKVKSNVDTVGEWLHFTWPESVKVKEGQPTDFIEGTRVDLDSYTFEVTYEDGTVEELKLGQKDRFGFYVYESGLYKQGEKVTTKYPPVGNYVYRLAYSFFWVSEGGVVPQMKGSLEIPVTVVESDTDCIWKETDRVEPTCTEKGSITETCSLHGEVRKTEISATGAHTYVWKTDKSATCGADGSRHQECTVCGQKGAVEIIKATGQHKYGEWSTITAATVFAAGSQERTCSVCGEKESSSIAKLKATVQLNVTAKKTFPLAVKQSVNSGFEI